MPLGLERPPPAIIRPTLTVKGGRSSFSICQVSVLYNRTMPDFAEALRLSSAKRYLFTTNISQAAPASSEVCDRQAIP